MVDGEEEEVAGAEEAEIPERFVSENVPERLDSEGELFIDADSPPVRISGDSAFSGAR